MTYRRIWRLHDCASRTSSSQEAKILGDRPGICTSPKDGKWRAETGKASALCLSTLLLCIILILYYTIPSIHTRRSQSPLNDCALSLRLCLYHASQPEQHLAATFAALYIHQTVAKAHAASVSPHSVLQSGESLARRQQRTGGSGDMSGRCVTFSSRPRCTPCSSVLCLSQTI